MHCVPKLNPSSSPSGPPLLSGPPTLIDIHQIFTGKLEAIFAKRAGTQGTDWKSWRSNQRARSPTMSEEDARMSGAGPSAPSPMIIASPRVEAPPETPARRGGAERRKWPQHSSEPALTLDCPPAISTPLSSERRSSVGELLDLESRQACMRSRSPQAPHALRQPGAPSGMGLTIECSPRISRRVPAASGPRRTALALTVARASQSSHPKPEP